MRGFVQLWELMKRFRVCRQTHGDCDTVIFAHVEFVAVFVCECCLCNDEQQQKNDAIFSVVKNRLKIVCIIFQRVP